MLDWILTVTGGRPVDFETDGMRRQISVWFEGERILVIPYEAITEHAHIELPPIPDKQRIDSSMTLSKCDTTLVQKPTKTPSRLLRFRNKRL